MTFLLLFQSDISEIDLSTHSLCEKGIDSQGTADSTLSNLVRLLDGQAKQLDDILKNQEDIKVHVVIVIQNEQSGLSMPTKFTYM